MSRTLLITGATGFLGKSVLKQLPWDQFDEVILAVRNQNKLPESCDTKAVVKSGNLSDKTFCEEITKGVDTVLHMASATGKLASSLYRESIVDNTENLVESSEKNGVKQFIYISSIAVNFEKAPRYFYAEAKKEAEQIVSSSSLKTAIVRPTMIFGTGSPVFNGFKSLALLPFIPMFGKGDAKIQPVDVKDAAFALISLTTTEIDKDCTIELGGNEVLTIKELMKSIAVAGGKEKPSFLSLPLSLIVACLRITEPLLYRFLPFTLGQLASFRNHSTSSTTDPAFACSTGIDTMIKEGMKPVPPSRAELIKECNTYCKYLTGKEPDQYLTEKYLDYHSKLKPTGTSAFDGIVNKFASSSPLITKMCDAWCRFFFPTSLLRHKLTYLLGIAETVPPYSNILDSSDNMSIPVLFIRMGIRGVIMAIQICLASIFLIPGKIVLHKPEKEKQK